MKNAFFQALAASSVFFLLVSCGGGGGGGGGTPAPAGPAPAVSGLAVNSSTGNAATGVTVTGAGQSATTSATGTFTMDTAPAGPALFLFSSDSFAQQARSVNVVPGTTAGVSVQMVPVAATITFDPAAPPAALTVPGSPAQVVIGANTLRTGTGAMPTGQVTARLTPISVQQESSLLPGDYSLSTGGQFESFGGFDITFTDDAGNALTLVAATTATIRVPVGTRATALPANAALMSFNVATGLWVQEPAVATLGGAVGSQYYEATVTHFTAWSAGQSYTVSNITVCLSDAVGQPVAGARIASDGISYSGIGAALTDASGNAVVPMKRSGQAIISATFGTRVSNSATISTAQSAADFTLTPCLILAAPNSGMAIKLTWGATPADLDSHLKGPNNTHVNWTALGSLSAAPFAKLDVDDVTSFGPEVITVTRLARGTYRYFVHNFTGNPPTMTASPARVELRFGLNTRIFTPPAGEGGNEYWHVFDFSVNSDCSVVITPPNPVNAWNSAEPANPSAGLTSEYCILSNEPPLPLAPTPPDQTPPAGPLPLPPSGGGGGGGAGGLPLGG